MKSGTSRRPDAFTIETRKSVVGGNLAATPAAAAVIDSIVGSTNLPAAFFIAAYGILFCRAYASSM